MTRFRSSLFLIALVFAACTPAETFDLAIENVTVIDAVSGARAGQTVVVDDGRIVRVADAVQLGAVNADRVVDGSGRYLIPGLWDFHVHLTYDDRFTETMPELFLRWGITSIRDTGGALDKVLPVVTAMKADGAIAPRVFFAGPLLDGSAAVYDGQDRPALGISNADADEARAHVAELAEAGVDFLKVYEMVTPAIFAAVVAEARVRGLPLDGHVPLSMLTGEAGPQMNSMEHVRNIEMDCAANAEALLTVRLQLLATLGDGPAGDLRGRIHSLQRLPAVAAYDETRCALVIETLSNTIQVPTLRLNALGIQSPFLRDDWAVAAANLPASAEGPWNASAAAAIGAAPARDTTFGAWSLFLIDQMNAAGVPIAAGTDTPIGFAIPGWSLHNELDMLVRAGLTPMEALGAATLRPAEFFGLSDEMGTIEEGRLADLVLLSGNPLDDITNTRTLKAVVTAGRFFELAELNRMADGGR